MGKITDEELLQKAQFYKYKSIGLSDGASGEKLYSDREKAQNFYKGTRESMQKYLPAISGRSGATEQTLSKVVKQIKPMIAAIFRDERTVAFIPRSEEDRAQAEMETDYLNYVIFERNSGYRLCETASHDALLMKNAFFYWWWEKGEMPKPREIVDASPNEYLQDNELYQNGKQEIYDIVHNEDGTFNYTIQDPLLPGEVKICVWPAHHVGVDVNATTVKDTNYMVFRSYVPRQQLLAEGYDEDLVYTLPQCQPDDTLIEYAIDQAGESEERHGGGNADVDAETVEINYHYIKVWEKSEKRMVIYYLVTGNSDENMTILKREEVEEIPCSTITPYPISHRFYGQSVADLLFEVQLQATAVKRIEFDRAYTALNGKWEISEKDSSKYTLKDATNGKPGGHIRSKTGSAIRPIQQGSLNFNVDSLMESIKEDVEEITGVTRQANGLDSDSAHETKAAFLSQMKAGNIRVREIAVNFAETGWRDMALGVHKMIRTYAIQPQKVELGGKFVDIDATNWQSRDSMRLEIANDGGREADMAKYNNLLQIHAQLGTAQQSVDGELTNHNVVLATLNRLVTSMGVKDAKDVVLQPDDPNSQQQQQQKSPTQAELKQQHDMMIAQQSQALAQQQHEADMAQAQAELGLKEQQQQIDAAEQQRQDDIRIREIETNAELERYKADLIAQQKSDAAQAQIALQDQIEGLKGMLANKQIDVNAQLDMKQLDAQHQQHTVDTLVGIHTDEQDRAHDTLRDGIRQYQKQVTSNSLDKPVTAVITDSKNNDPND